MVDVVRGNVGAKFVVDPVSKVSPKCFFKVNESLAFVGFSMSLVYEGGGEDREMVRRELF